MLQSLLSSNSSGALPPGLANLLDPSGDPQPSPPTSSSSATSTTSTRIFRALHVLISVFYAVFLLHAQKNYNGDLTARAPLLTAAATARAARAFWSVLAAEAALLAWQGWSEERGRGAGPREGMLGVVEGLLPTGWAQLLRSVLWGWKVVSSAVEDAMLAVFVLGLVVWWRGGGA